MERKPTSATALGRARWGAVAAVAVAAHWQQRDSSPLLAWAQWGWNSGVASLALLAYALYRLALTPARVRSKNYHSSKNARYKALRQKFFPPGFANGWHCVCNATDLENGRVHSIDALGTHMVAFRAEDGAVGVLDAFCPHLGAHLGSGGTVVGNSLRCPFHGWEFATSGKCTAIPYKTSKEVPERAKTKAYEVREILERVFIWFDAEGRPPAWELECHEDLEEGVKSGAWYLGQQRTIEFEMHSCEMHMNSADPVHFQTLHAPMPFPVLEHMVTGLHTIKPTYGAGEMRGKMVQRPHLGHMAERTLGMWFFGCKWLPVPFSALAGANIDTGVTFEGPNIVHFMLSTPFGKLRLHKTLLSVEPFKQFVEARWFAERRVPRWVVYFFTTLAARALEQDRAVWDNKMYHKKPMLVAGDGPFPAFMRWYGQFYSESSEEVGRRNIEW